LPKRREKGGNFFIPKVYDDGSLREKDEKPPFILGGGHYIREKLVLETKGGFTLY